MNVEHNGYMVVNDGTYGNLEIRSIGKGALPDMLKGSFTKHGFATRAIDSYISKKKAVIEVIPEVEVEAVETAPIKKQPKKKTVVRKTNGVKTNGKAERTSRG